ncbi:rhodopsin-like [Macrobrachium rosenbergii]|uniref:rhodopsin-like n=1 Tax=Macrobrachium rosenbergii TaxID=79674 RepID=UPI0034D663F5
MGYWDDPAKMASNSLPSTNPYGNYTVVDTVHHDLLHLVDAHWYQFPPMNPLWYNLIAVWMVVMGLLAVGGNFVVIWVFMCTKSLRSPANMYVVSLAFSDFGMMLTMCPPILVNCYYQTWSFSDVACQIYGMLGSSFGTASIWAMVFITLDRYNVIVKGLSATPLTPKGAVLRIFFVWAQTFFWGVLPLFGFCRYVPEGNMTACGTDYLSEDLWSHIYLYLYSVDCYIFPLFLIIYCYSFILKAVATHEKQMREQAKKMGVKSLRNDPEAKKTSNECRLAKVALTTVSLWFIAWTPYFIINMAGLLYKPMVTPLFSIWGSVFAKANAVYNPIVYAISHPKYRAAMEKKIPCLSCATDRDDDSSSTSDATTVASTSEKA